MENRKRIEQLEAAVNAAVPRATPQVTITVLQPGEKPESGSVYFKLLGEKPEEAAER